MEWHRGGGGSDLCRHRCLNQCSVRHHSGLRQPGLHNRVNRLLLSSWVDLNERASRNRNPP